jgi:hypothetical protein
MALAKKDLQSFATKERGAFESLLAQFVEVPSISADPDRVRDLERVAELGAETLRRFGAKAELYRVPGGSPVVLGSFDAGPGARSPSSSRSRAIPTSAAAPPTTRARR